MKTFETSGQLRYLGGYKYMVCDTFWIMTDVLGYDVRFKNKLRLEPNGKLTITDSFGFDGGSGPTVDTKSSMRATAVHDAGYCLERAGLIPEKERIKFDAMLRDIAIFDGMWRWRAWSWYWAVRKFAFGSARRQERKELLAP